MKECANCKETKKLTEYHRRKCSEDGLDLWCKGCKTEYSKSYYLLNKDKIKQKSIDRHGRLKNETSYKQTRKQYAENNRDAIKLYKAEYRKQNKDAISEHSKKIYYSNHEQRKLKLREYQKTDVAKKLSAKRHRERWDNDESYRLKILFRGRIYEAFKRNNWKKKSKTTDLLGVSVDIAKSYLEKQFTKGMSWDNQGEWHIDHVIPLASAKDEESLRQLCHYTNLQPLWAEDNIKKSDKIIETQTKLTL